MNKSIATLILTLGIGNYVMAADTNVTGSPHWDAKLYQKNSVRLQQNTSVELLETLGISSQSSVFDLGCGDGKITVEIAKKAEKVHGVDLSEPMINLARLEYAGHPNLTFDVGNAETVTSDIKYDWVVSFFCLQWVPDKQKAFDRISDLLLDGGKSACIMTDRNPYLLQARTELINSPNWSNYFVDFVDATTVIDNDSYPEFASSSGLVVESYREYPKSIFYDSGEELKIFIRMVTAAINVLSEESLKTKFIDELFSRYLELVPEVQGTKNHITYTIKELICRKNVV